MAALAMLGNLKGELGDLDRLTAWLTVTGTVNAAPDFGQTTDVVNGFSDLVLELYGPEAGTHARTASGVATLPLPVVISAKSRSRADCQPGTKEDDRFTTCGT